MEQDEACDQSVVLVKNLPAGVTDQRLRGVLEVAAAATDAQRYDRVLRITRRSATAVYVQMRTDQGADAVVAGPVAVGDVVLDVEKPKTQMTLFFARMGGKITQEQFKKMCKRFGPVEEASIIFDHETRRSKGCGFVKFVYHDDAMACYDFHAERKKFIVEWARSPIHRASQADRFTIFIGNLAKPVATKQAVEEHFRRYGPVEKVTLVNPIKKAPFAFVRYTNARAPLAAIRSEHNTLWEGQIITVELSENSTPPRKEASPPAAKLDAAFHESPAHTVPVHHASPKPREAARFATVPEARGYRQTRPFAVYPPAPPAPGNVMRMLGLPEDSQFASYETPQPDPFALDAFMTPPAPEAYPTATSPHAIGETYSRKFDDPPFQPGIFARPPAPGAERARPAPSPAPPAHLTLAFDPDQALPTAFPLDIDHEKLLSSLLSIPDGTWDSSKVSSSSAPHDDGSN